MQIPAAPPLICGIGSLFVALAIGCEALHEAGVPGMEQFIDRTARFQAAEEHRNRYRTDRDPKALRWLLAHRVSSGMPLSDVNQALGQEGLREFDDTWIKTNGGNYRTGDEVYKWGPDAGGHTVYLVFRDGQLVNYDPREFE